MTEQPEYIRDGVGWESGQPVPITVPSLDTCPHCRRGYDDDGPTVGAVDMAALMRAVEHGKTEGQRELLQRLFRGASTGSEIIERAALLAFALAWPGDACPLTAGDLASFTGVSERTAARRAAAAKLAGRFADE